MNTNALIKGSLSDLAQRDNMTLAESFLNADAILIVDMSGSMGALFLSEMASMNSLETVSRFD